MGKITDLITNESDGLTKEGTSESRPSIGNKRIGASGKRIPAVMNPQRQWIPLKLGVEGGVEGERERGREGDRKRRKWQQIPT